MKLSHFQCEKKQNTSYASVRAMSVVAFSTDSKKSLNVLKYVFLQIL